jgi:hypothetical protein
MNDMERRNLEDSFKEAFERAEKEPNENVWTNIELELEKNAAGKMKRRLLFYQLLAAASVSFALLTIGIGFYAFKLNSIDTTIAQNQSPTKNSPAEEKAKIADSSKGSVKQSDAAGNEVPETLNNQHSSITNKNELATNREGDNTILDLHEKDGINSASDNNRMAILPFDNTVTNSTTPVVLDFMKERPLPQLYSVKSVSLNFEKSESIADPGKLMLLQLKDRENELATEENTKTKADTENLWTSVGFSAGGYNSANPSISQSAGSSTPNLANVAYNNAISNQTSASGVSYSFGMSMGTRISGRWVMQSGINYMNNNSEYVSNQVVYSQDFKNFKAASISDLRASSNNNVLQTANHKVSSSLEYLSIPVQAGFIAIDRKLGVQLNAGVATDFFIQNTIDPEGSSLDKTQISRGSESPYRSTNFSGLVGTEFSYRFASRYRVSLNPGIRYPFNSIYKSESGISSTPFIFDVGLRFRYIFN